MTLGNVWSLNGEINLPTERLIACHLVQQFKLLRLPGQYVDGTASQEIR